MKLKYILAALTLIAATFVFQSPASATGLAKTFIGQVLEVNQDEEGSSIMIKTAEGLTESVFVPRSRANEAIIKRAIKAQEMKSTFTISTQGL